MTYEEAKEVMRILDEIMVICEGNAQDYISAEKSVDEITNGEFSKALQEHALSLKEVHE